MMKKHFPIFLSLVLMVFLACQPQAGDQTSSAPEAAATPPPKAKPLGLQPPYPIADSSDYQEVQGIKIYVVEKGNGAVPKPGSNVIINYRGTLLSDGSQFDSSFDKDGVVDFPLTNLIQGWQIGLTQVPTGSKVKLIIPPELAYGPADRPGIPGNSTLVFDIDLISTY
ncbi:MAG: FKBP-type peptidyl-prolyl cis-trans isomerase [Bacteroidota bacterium]